MAKKEPNNPKAYTSNFNAFYTQFSTIYDFLVRHTSLWKGWLGPAIPHIRGPRVLEVSFGTGWLITQYADQFETYGIDLNEKMIQITSRNLHKVGIRIPLQRGSVEALPYRNDSFDSLVNTMAFSGYPKADLALSEFHRVIKPGGRLILIDMSYPEDGNWIGTILAQFVNFSGDIVRDMSPIFSRNGFTFSRKVIGLSGVVQLYIAQKVH